MPMKRIFHQGIARMATRWPALSNKLVASFTALENTSVPWQPVSKALADSKVALITTAGIHHKSQQPFDMMDSMGDPSFRRIDGERIANNYHITHDYYDHRDADQDLNVVFPIIRLQEMQAAGCIGAISEVNYSFMGHIGGPHLTTLINQTAPQVAAHLRDWQVDVVLLTPA